MTEVLDLIQRTNPNTMSNSNKTTSRKAGTAASKTLGDGRTSADSKSASGSALSQAAKSPKKNTGTQAAASASNVLQSENTGSRSKTAAASALAQTPNQQSKKSK